jgi:hypothetical protein
MLFEKLLVSMLANLFSKFKKIFVQASIEIAQEAPQIVVVGFLSEIEGLNSS